MLVLDARLKAPIRPVLENMVMASSQLWWAFSITTFLVETAWIESQQLGFPGDNSSTADHVIDPGRRFAHCCEFSSVDASKSLHP